MVAFDSGGAVASGCESFYQASMKEEQDRDFAWYNNVRGVALAQPSILNVGRGSNERLLYTIHCNDCGSLTSIESSRYLD